MKIKSDSVQFNIIEGETVPLTVFLEGSIPIELSTFQDQALRWEVSSTLGSTRPNTYSGPAQSDHRIQVLVPADSNSQGFSGLHGKCFPIFLLYG